MMVRAYFDILYSLAIQGGCMRRKYAALIVKNGIVLGQGYACTVDGTKCVELGTCPRCEMQQKYTDKAKFFEKCRVVHAEMAALLSCSDTTVLKGGSIYLLGLSSINNDIYQSAFPCELCRKCLIFAGIRDVCVFISPNEYRTYDLLREDEQI